MNPDNLGRCFVDVMVSASVEQHITLPTRNHNNSSKLIDHIWTNSTSSEQAGVFDSGITDHYIAFAFIPCTFENKFIHQKFRDHSQTSSDDLENSVLINILLSDNFSLQWNQCTDFDDDFLLFSTKLYELYDSCCPFITERVSSNRMLTSG